MDLVQLQVANESDLPCLQSLRPLVGALATTRFPIHAESKITVLCLMFVPCSGGKGLVVDILKNSSVLFLIPLATWEDPDANNSIQSQ